MPLYEYECTQCGKRFEVILNSSEKASMVECPECKGKAKRHPSSFSLGASLDGKPSCAAGRFG